MTRTNVTAVRPGDFMFIHGMTVAVTEVEAVGGSHTCIHWHADRTFSDGQTVFKNDTEVTVER